MKKLSSKLYLTGFAIDRDQCRVQLGNKLGFYVIRYPSRIAVGRIVVPIKIVVVEFPILVEQPFKHRNNLPFPV